MKNQGIIKEFQRGNALIIILIIIALLSALTITVTRMGESENDVSQEEAKILASQILRQASTVANATTSLLAKGCSLQSISFENPIEPGYINSQTPTDGSCRIFDPNGAGLAFPKQPSSSNTGWNWLIAAGNSVEGVGPERETITACTNNCQDLLMVLVNVDLAVCKSINQMVNISTAWDTPPPQAVNSFNSVTKFGFPVSLPAWDNYSNLNTGTGDILTSGAAPLNTSRLWDKKTGCFEATGGYIEPAMGGTPGNGVYIFYQVLAER